jgi:hypothetical protein
MSNPTSWDQRIPNKPLYERQFLIERPPTIPQNRPHNTSLCMPVQNCQPYLLMDRIAEEDAMRYWYYIAANSNNKGVNSGCKKDISLEQMMQKYPNRPWLHGVHRNISHDSQLRNRNYYNPQDCVNGIIQDDLNAMNRIADQAMIRQMTANQLFRNGTLSDGRLWNQSTSVRANEPIDFDYDEMIRSCNAKVNNSKSVPFEL